jgi:serine/threonine-protein phosphatase 5
MCIIEKAIIFLGWNRINQKSSTNFRQCEKHALDPLSLCHEVSISIKKMVSIALPESINAGNSGIEQLLSKDDYDISHLNLLIDHFNNGGSVPKPYVMKLLRSSIEYLTTLPNVVEISIDEGEVSRINVCGDTHGQYKDFQNIFSEEIGGHPSPKNMYLFNGDMVDRGRNSFEIMTVLLFTMLASPNTMYILRGNHETKECYNVFGFRYEILRKFDLEVFLMFQELFKTLPFAAVIEKKVFVTHGGLGF